MLGLDGTKTRGWLRLIYGKHIKLPAHFARMTTCIHKPSTNHEPSTYAHRNRKLLGTHTHFAGGSERTLKQPSGRAKAKRAALLWFSCLLREYMAIGNRPMRPEN